ncbi:Major facilitator superfamily permease [Candidatus Terasakiella magnetica]|nr:Major facilitator superfamily permease [Candidatus Terasakiella magnetica]
MNDRQEPGILTLVSRVVLPFSAGYFLSYLYRTVNAVLAPDIARSIDLHPSHIGLMTGIYFITFAAAQLPLGILLDRYGPRRVEALLLAFAAAGALAFSLADSVTVLVLGRALVGFGVSACLMAPLKANVQFFPPARIALMNGVILASGGLGAVAATAPVQIALQFTDWRGVYAAVAALTLAAGVTIWLTVPDRPLHSGGGLGQQLRDVGEIFRDATFLRVAPATMASLGSFMAIQGLWAGPWLRDVVGLSVAETSHALTIMAGAMGIGYLSAGALAERLERMGVPPITLGLVGMALHTVTLGAMAAGWSAAPSLLAALYGFTGASSSVNYAVLTRRFPMRLAGRVNTSLNLSIFITAFAAQWGLGALIGVWDKVDGHWPSVAWSSVLAIPLVLNILALMWLAPVCRTNER